GLETLRGELGAHPLQKLVEYRVDDRRVRGMTLRAGDQLLVHDVRGDQAERAMHRRRMRYDYLTHAKFLAYRRQVHPGSAAGREQCELARIEAALHGGLVQEVVDHRVGELMDRGRRFDRGHLQWLGDQFLERPPRLVDIERSAPAQEIVRVQVA